nr:MAG TPA: Middle operon regulator, TRANSCRIPTION.2A [Caudoviricetes sp.]
MSKTRGISYKKRVADINRIYDRYARSGLSNRAIYRRYIYPVYGISERTFYNIMNATAEGDKTVVASDMPSLFDIDYENE